uniref:ARAD1D19954p n=1 Tax=Blastobotrys adeninivorans TaxID=409370 RepID=A0A060TA24_BLAAD
MSSLIGITSLTLLGSLVVTATIGAVVFSPLLMMLAMVSFIVWMAILVGIVAFQYRRRTRLKGRLETLRNAATLSNRRDQWRFFAQTEARQYMPRSEVARLDSRSKASTNLGSNVGSMRHRVSPGIQLPPDDGLPFEHDTYRVISATKLYSRSPSPVIDFAGEVDEARDTEQAASGSYQGDNQLLDIANQDNLEDGDQEKDETQDEVEDLTQDENRDQDQEEDIASDNELASGG